MTQPDKLLRDELESSADWLRERYGYENLDVEYTEEMLLDPRMVRGDIEMLKRENERLQLDYDMAMLTIQGILHPNKDSDDEWERRDFERHEELRKTAPQLHAPSKTRF
jgi:hypothetical protein